MGRNRIPFGLMWGLILFGWIGLTVWFQISAERQFQKMRAIALQFKANADKFEHIASQCLLVSKETAADRDRWREIAENTIKGQQ